MTSNKDVANALLSRLLTGERGQVPLHLSMLLEKSSPLREGDDHYRRILPPELACIRLSPEQVQEITQAICTEVFRNPDHALISAVSFTGADLVTRTMASILTHPPRELSLSEHGAILAVLVSFLAFRLGQESEFLPKTELEQLVRISRELKSLEETGPSRIERMLVRDQAGQLLDGLKKLGIGEG